MNRDIQSAAKLGNENFLESSETIPQGSTLELSSGSGSPSARNGGGDDIVHRNKLKFIEKANLKFNNKFDYSKIEYISAKTSITIICPEHGEFTQTPDKHLLSKYGCPICAKLYRDRSLLRNNILLAVESHTISFEDFVRKANTKYNNKFLYLLIEPWKGIVSTSIKVICPQHGEFVTIARSHILTNNTYGCPLCAKTMRSIHKTYSYNQVIEEMKRKHSNFYTYPQNNETNYVNTQSIILIECPEHGIFYKRANKHLSGQGCPVCTIQNLVHEGRLVGGYCEELFALEPWLKDELAILYYLEINNGLYYKIGISRISSHSRIKSLKSKAKLFNEELTINLIDEKSCSLYQAYLIELFILLYYKEYRCYKKWSTELFALNIYNDIKSFFDK